jgi:hypothetical protein
MQSGTSIEAPMLPKALLHLLGVGLRRLHVALPAEPLPPSVSSVLLRMGDKPRRLPRLLSWRQASGRGTRMVSHQGVAAL